MPTDPGKKVGITGNSSLYKSMMPFLLFPLMMGGYDLLPSPFSRGPEPRAAKMGQKQCPVCGEWFYPESHNKAEVCSADCFKIKHLSDKKPVELNYKQKLKIYTGNGVLHCNSCQDISEDCNNGKWYVFHQQLICEKCANKVLEYKCQK